MLGLLRYSGASKSNVRVDGEILLLCAPAKEVVLQRLIRLVPPLGEGCKKRR